MRVASNGERVNNARVRPLSYKIIPNRVLDTNGQLVNFRISYNPKIVFLPAGVSKMCL